jgi:hypothetical protein
MVCAARGAVTSGTAANETEGALPACAEAAPANSAANNASIQISLEFRLRKLIIVATTHNKAARNNRNKYTRNSSALAAAYLLSLLSLQSRCGDRG